MGTRVVCAQVGDEKRPWANGKGMIFDTSFVHETFNEVRGRDGGSDRDSLTLWRAERAGYRE